MMVNALYPGRRGNPPVFLVAGAILLAGASVAAAWVDPAERTANLPDSWLVLYNAESADSATWAAWYQQQWGIPADHLLGLSASLDEHLPDLDAAQTQIIAPVRDFLAAHPEVEQTVMGIVLGYGLPGHYATPPLNPSIGGFSIADALQDMYDDGVPPASQKQDNTQNPHYYGNILPPGGRLTKATLPPNRYMAARIDGGAIEEAMALTIRTKTVASSSHSLAGEHVWHDYYDPAFPVGNHEWYWLRAAVQTPELADLPWSQFDLDGESGPVTPSNDAFRFCIYKLYGWSATDFAAEEPGSRVLAFHCNSFGAVTVRSTTSQSALFVPNALAAGYAAAIGATGEPQCAVGPFPDTILAALRERWTLGEAFYLANPYNDWMWTLVGDPFLTLPHWFDDVPPPPAASTSHPLPGTGDMNGDGVVNGLDIQLFVQVLASPGGPVTSQQLAAADLSGDDVIDGDDMFMFMVPVLTNAYDWSPLKGTADANGDGLVDGRDIAPFADMLVYGTEGYSLRCCWGADMNKDDQVTIEDLPPFVEALLLASTGNGEGGAARAFGSQPPAEPSSLIEQDLPHFHPSR